MFALSIAIRKRILPGKCPGVYLTGSPLWLVIARAVAALDIGSKVVNRVPVEVIVKEKSPFVR